MKALRRFFNMLLLAVLRHRPSRPEDIPRKLPPEALARALHEAQHLRRDHAVHVRELAADEMPGLPRRADTGEH